MLRVMDKVPGLLPAIQTAKSLGLGTYTDQLKLAAEECERVIALSGLAAPAPVVDCDQEWETGACYEEAEQEGNDDDDDDDDDGEEEEARGAESGRHPVRQQELVGVRRQRRPAAAAAAAAAADVQQQQQRRRQVGGGRSTPAAKLQRPRGKVRIHKASEDDEEEEDGLTWGNGRDGPGTIQQQRTTTGPTSTRLTIPSTDGRARQDEATSPPRKRPAWGGAQAGAGGGLAPVLQMIGSVFGIRPQPDPVGTSAPLGKKRGRSLNR